MMQYDDGKVYTTDILHLMAGEGVVGLIDHADTQLCPLEYPESVLKQFPGPAYGPKGCGRRPTGRRECPCSAPSSSPAQASRPKKWAI